MALRRILISGEDAALRKKSRLIDKVSPAIEILLEDMAETMRHCDGIGLAAPQVGTLRRIVILDPGDGIIRLINPEIVDEEGELTGYEGFLSIPGMRGIVRRPEKVTIQTLNTDTRPIRWRGEGLSARIMCHEIDHLDGILLIDKTEPGTIMRYEPRGGAL